MGGKGKIIKNEYKKTVPLCGTRSKTAEEDPAVYCKATVPYRSSLSEWYLPFRVPFLHWWRSNNGPQILWERANIQEQ